MFVEGAIRGTPPATAAVLGAAVFAGAKALKWWAIVTLGQAWTFRVIVVPQAPLVASGPYRLMRHPNYVGVIGELVGVALMTGAWIAGPVTTAGFAALIVKRIQVETRALSG
jgi:methyltransferase